MTRRILCLASAAFFLLVTIANLCAEEAPLAPYLSPEHFAAKQRAGDYLPYARTFLAEHPNDPRAAHITHDMLMVATVMQHAEEIKAARLRLLLHYPHSLPSSYVAKNSKAQDVAGLLKEHFNDDSHTLDREGLKRFVRAVEFGHRLFGPSFFDDDLWAQIALAAQDVRVATNCQRQIKKADGNAAKAVAIVLDVRLSLRDKFVELQTLRSYNTARAFQRFLLTELTEAERADIEVQSVVIENLLHEQRLAEAVPLLEKLCKDSHDARHHFWRAWAYAASGDSAKATKLLADFQRDFSSDGWAKAAAELADTLAKLDDSLARHTELGNEVGAALAASPPEVAEATLMWYDQNNRLTSTYFGVDLLRDAFELVSAIGDDQRLAYRSAPGECDVFLAGDAAINRYESRGVCPICTFGMPRKNGRFHFNFNFNTAPQGAGALQQSLKSLLSLPMFASDASRRQLLEDAVHSGYFPQPVTTKDGVTVLRWIRPQIDTPDFTALEVRLSHERRIVSVLNEKGAGAADLRYGVSRDIKLKPPAWPRLPVATAAEMAPQEFFRVFGAVMALMAQDQPTTASVANRAAKPVR